MTDRDWSFSVNKAMAVRAWERGFLIDLLNYTNGNISRAARRARMDRNHLRDLLSKHALFAVDFKRGAYR